MSKEIIVKFNKKTNQVEIETSGFSGASCTKEVESLLDKLSVDEWEREEKDEFYDEDETIAVGEM